MENINVTLDKAISARDFREIRDTLVTYIFQDPGFAKGVFDGKVAHCLSQGVAEADLFEEYNGASFESDESRWTNEYYASQHTAFQENFSKKRLAHLKQMGKKLFPPVANTSTAGSDVKKNSPAVGTHKEPTREAPGRLMIAAGVAALVVIGLVITCAISSR